MTVQGGAIVLVATFYDEPGGSAVDPSSVSLSIGTGGVDVYGPFTYPDDIAKIETGVYRYTHGVADDETVGDWTARWTAVIDGVTGYGYEGFEVTEGPYWAPLASTADVESRVGRDLTVAELARVENLIDDASAAVRVYTGRPFAETTTTSRMRVRFGRYVFLGRPEIVSITSVATVSGTELSYTWNGLEEIAVGISDRLDIEMLTQPAVVDVTYVHGSDTVHPAIKAVVAQMAARAFGRPADQSGVQQESIAGYSYSVGTAASSGAVGLLPDEKAVLDRFKRVGGTAWMGRR